MNERRWILYTFTISPSIEGLHPWVHGLNLKASTKWLPVRNKLLTLAWFGCFTQIIGPWQLQLLQEWVPWWADCWDGWMPLDNKGHWRQALKVICCSHSPSIFLPPSFHMSGAAFPDDPSSHDVLPHCRPHSHEIKSWRARNSEQMKSFLKLFTWVFLTPWQEEISWQNGR